MLCQAFIKYASFSSDPTWKSYPMQNFCPIRLYGKLSYYFYLMAGKGTDEFKDFKTSLQTLVLQIELYL